MNLDKHPIFWDIYNVVQAIEVCGASPALTTAVIKAGELQKPAERLVDRIAELEAENARLIGTKCHPCHDDCKLDGCENRRLRAALGEAEKFIEALTVETKWHGAISVDLRTVARITLAAIKKARGGE